MDAACFDMDGVLIDSEEHWVAVEEEEILPTVVPSEDVPVEEITGRYYREIYDYLADNYEVAVDRETALELFEDAAATIYGERAQLLPGTRATLTTVRERTTGVALVTSSRRDWADTVVERFDLGEYFDTVVSASDLDGPGKPEPNIYERAAAELGVAAENCLAIEDSTLGVRAATAAGMTCLGYRTHLNPDTDLSPADCVVEGADALRQRVRTALDGRE